MFLDPSRPGIAKAIVHESIPTSDLIEKDLIYLRNKCKNIIESPLITRYPNYFN